MSLSLDLGKMMGASSLVQSQWAQRAQVQWARILDKPTDIELRRGNELIPVQTVRIEEEDTFPIDVDDASGVSFMKRCIIFGFRGHPEIDDTDIKDWDTFIFEERKYTVIAVNRHLIGQVQAYCEAI